MRTLITHIFLITTCMVEFYFQFCYKNFAKKLSLTTKSKFHILICFQPDAKWQTFDILNLEKEK